MPPERSLVADEELRLIADVVERLERLDDPTRRRVVDYLFSRYFAAHLTGASESVAAPPTAAAADPWDTPTPPHG